MIHQIVGSFVVRGILYSFSFSYSMLHHMWGFVLFVSFVLDVQVEIFINASAVSPFHQYIISRILQSFSSPSSCLNIPESYNLLGRSQKWNKLHQSVFLCANTHTHHASLQDTIHVLDANSHLGGILAHRLLPDQSRD